MFGTGETLGIQTTKSVVSSRNLDVPSSPIYSLVSETEQNIHEKSFIQCMFC